LGSEVPLSRRTNWISETIGLDLEWARFVALATKEKKVTVGAFFYNQNGTPKVLVQMMGTNNLPGEQGIAKLAGALDGGLARTC
jgi:hypothetical protein